MPAADSWNTLTPLDGSVGGWFAATVRGADFGTVAGLVGRSFPAYAVVHQAPHDDFDPYDGDEDLPVDEVYAALRDVLARHTTSERFVCGLWEGCGYFGGGYRSTGVVAADDPGPPGPRWEADPGDFGPAAERARRLPLPGRDHVLFDGVLDHLRDLPISAGHSGREVPSVLWPEDRAWVTACDVDLRVSLVGGSEALVADLVADPRLRVDRVGPGEPVREAWVPVGERY